MAQGLVKLFRFWNVVRGDFRSRRPDRCLLFTVHGTFHQYHQSFAMGISTWRYSNNQSCIYIYLAPEWGYKSSGIVLRCSMGTVNYCNSRWELHPQPTDKLSMYTVEKQGEIATEILTQHVLSLFMFVLSNPLEHLNIGFPSGIWKKSPCLIGKSYIYGSCSIAICEIARWKTHPTTHPWNQVVCSFSEGNSKVDLTPKDVNARTRVHEYGGVPYWIGADGAMFLKCKWCVTHRQLNSLLWYRCPIWFDD